MGFISWFLAVIMVIVESFMGFELDLIIITLVLYAILIHDEEA